jgi:predicted nucleic acid-binding protein
LTKIVVDANITIALFVNLPYSNQSEKKFLFWRKQDFQLFAPALWPAEIVSTLRKMVGVGQLSSEDARLAISCLAPLQIQVVSPHYQLLDDSFVWSGKINHKVAYDAQYLALAESLQAEFWTADQKLYHTLHALKVAWARWIEETH